MDLSRLRHHKIPLSNASNKIRSSHHTKSEVAQGLCTFGLAARGDAVSFFGGVVDRHMLCGCVSKRKVFEQGLYMNRASRKGKGNRSRQQP